MIVECPYCQASVEAKVVASHTAYDPEEDPGPFKASLLECPKCKNTLLAGQTDVTFDGDWDTPSRLWPSPKRFLSWNIPQVVRISLEEGEKCLRAGAYMASTVMCGRALEGVCRHFKTKSPYLGGGLKELLDNEIIDRRLFQWSQELQKHRNVAAHANEQTISRQDAEDLLEFVTAIRDYIFVLNEKFNDFMERQNKSAKK